MNRSNRAAMACALSVFGAACGPPPAPAPNAHAPAASPTAPIIASPQAPFELDVGEVAEVSLKDGTATVALASPNENEVFVALVASTALDAAGTFDYRIGSAPDGAPLAPLSIRDRCSVNAFTATNGSEKEASATPLSTASAPKVGATRKFWFRSKDNVDQITAQAIAVGTRAVVWRDTTRGAEATLDTAFVEGFLNDFEQLILPRAREVFGWEGDIDSDGRIALLFTPKTRDHAVAFFSGCDLEADCDQSNQGELLYLTPPNAIDPPYNTPQAIKEILAHELEHLIHHHRKVNDNHLPDGDPESLYALEGFGALAQDTSGFQSGNLYVTRAGLAELDVVDLHAILQRHMPYDRNRDGPLRGLSYLWTRWLYDRAGGDTANVDGSISDGGGPAFMTALIGDPRPIADALPLLMSHPIEEMALDFATTIAVSNRPELEPAGPKNACFAFARVSTDPKTNKRRGASLYALFHGQAMGGPLERRLSEADGRVRAGGFDILRIEADGPATAFTLSVDPSARPRLRVARLR